MHFRACQSLQWTTVVVILLQLLSLTHMLPISSPRQNSPNIDSLIDPIFQAEQDDNLATRRHTKSVYNTVIRVPEQQSCPPGQQRYREGSPCVTRYSSSSGPTFDDEYRLTALKELQRQTNNRRNRPNRNRVRTTTTTESPVTTSTTLHDLLDVVAIDVMELTSTKTEAFEPTPQPALGMHDKIIAPEVTTGKDFLSPTNQDKLNIFNENTGNSHERQDGNGPEIPTLENDPESLKNLASKVQQNPSANDVTTLSKPQDESIIAMIDPVLAEISAETNSTAPEVPLPSKLINPHHVVLSIVNESHSLTRKGVNVPATTVNPDPDDLSTMSNMIFNEDDVVFETEKPMLKEDFVLKSHSEGIHNVEMTNEKVPEPQNLISDHLMVPDSTKWDDDASRVSASTTNSDMNPQFEQFTTLLPSGDLESHRNLASHSPILQLTLDQISPLGNHPEAATPESSTSVTYLEIPTYQSSPIPAVPVHLSSSLVTDFTFAAPNETLTKILNYTDETENEDSLTDMTTFRTPLSQTTVVDEDLLMSEMSPTVIVNIPPASVRTVSASPKSEIDSALNLQTEDRKDETPSSLVEIEDNKTTAINQDLQKKGPFETSTNGGPTPSLEIGATNEPLMPKITTINVPDKVATLPTPQDIPSTLPGFPLYISQKDTETVSSLAPELTEPLPKALTVTELPVFLTSKPVSINSQDSLNADKNAGQKAGRISVSIPEEDEEAQFHEEEIDKLHNRSKTRNRVRNLNDEQFEFRRPQAIMTPFTTSPFQRTHPDFSTARHMHHSSSPSGYPRSPDPFNGHGFPHFMSVDFLKLGENYRRFRVF